MFSSSSSVTSSLVFIWHPLLDKPNTNTRVFKQTPHPPLLENTRQGWDVLEMSTSGTCYGVSRAKAVHHRCSGFYSIVLFEAGELIFQYFKSPIAYPNYLVSSSLSRLRGSLLPGSILFASCNASIALFTSPLCKKARARPI
jgi:hypothetical protein